MPHHCAQNVGGLNVLTAVNVVADIIGIVKVNQIIEKESVDMALITIMTGMTKRLIVDKK